MSPRTPISLFVVVLVLFIPLAADAQWQTDGVALCTEGNAQWYPMIVSDGAGGAIVTWQDHRNGVNWDIYAQRVNAAGVPQWLTDGVALCTAANDQQKPTLVADGAGGAIVTWEDHRSDAGDIYTQRVNALGAPQWTANGVALCTAANVQNGPTIDLDGAGGVIVIWSDARSGAGDIYTQRVNASGAPQWAANGVALCTATGLQYDSAILADGAGGAIVAWDDGRFGVNTNDCCAQRVNASGVVQWVPDGVDFAFAPGVQQDPSIISDGGAGFIAAWSDGRSPAPNGIYAQRLNACGALWTAAGIYLSGPGANQPKIASDSAGGAIVAWINNNPDIYAQRVSASGAVQWVANGVALCSDPNIQLRQTTVSDGAGGAIVAWEDLRNVNADIYAQRVNASGTVQWVTNGLALCTAVYAQYFSAMVSDGAGGAIVTWQDDRNSSGGGNANSDIYAIRVGPAGQIPTSVGGTATRVPSLFVGANHPNPFSTTTTMEIQLPARSDLQIEVIDAAGRRVRESTLKDVPAGSRVVEFDGRDDDKHPLPSGVYFYRVIANGTTATRKMVIVYIESSRSRSVHATATRLPPLQALTRGRSSSKFVRAFLGARARTCRSSSAVALCS